MKTFLCLMLLTVISESFASPPLQLEETRGILHAHKQKNIPSENLSSRNIIRPNYILPHTVIPEKYTLKIRPILYTYENEAGAEYTAPGHVEILTTCLNASNEIVIHKHPTLNITSVQVIAESNNANITVIRTDYLEIHHFYTIYLGSNLVVNQKYKIIMDFIAPIASSTEGLYRASFTNQAGQIKRMATTQFESVSARQAFPCFDEPNLRATFKISIARRSGDDFIALSNEGWEQRNIADPDLPNWVWDEFYETVSMPTYLVALIVAEEYMGTFRTNVFDKVVGVYGPRYLIDAPVHSGEFAVDTSAKIITFLQEKYVHKYALNKIDSISIPAGFFSAGAMENWGLNTYRQEYLLFINGESSEINRYRISSILTHELAHQWFGNQVTCKWWSDLWLNEGFASYITFMGIHHAFPEFDADREILWDSVQYALAYDVDVNEPVKNSAITPEEIERTFTTITYDKGASIIRMMAAFIGEPTFTNGLIKYLEEYKFNGAEQDNLFQVLTNQSIEDNVLPQGKTIKGIMDTWTLQAGYPLVRVSKVGNSRVYISQERFTKQGANIAIPHNFWEIPIAISTQDDTDFSVHSPKLWLSKNTLSQSYAFDSTSKWLIVNPDATGYYRVLYDNALTQLIIGQLQIDHTKISPLSRSQLLDDYFSLARNGYIDITAALEMTTYLSKEVDRVVWNSLLTVITRFLNVFRHEGISSFRSYFAPLIETALISTGLGWDQGPQEVGAPVLFRAKLIDWACALESDNAVAKAKQLLTLWTSGTNPIPRLDIQPPLYCAVVAHGGEVAYDLMMGLINNPSTSDFQKARLITAIACTKDTTNLQNLVELTKENGTPIGNNAVLVLQRVAVNTLGRNIVFNFIRNEFDALKAKTGGVNAFINVLTTLSTVFTKPSEKTNVQVLVEERNSDLVGFERSIETVLRNIDANIAFVNDYFDKTKAWFDSQI